MLNYTPIARMKPRPTFLYIIKKDGHVEAMFTNLDDICKAYKVDRVTLWICVKYGSLLYDTYEIIKLPTKERETRDLWKTYHEGR